MNIIMKKSDYFILCLLFFVVAGLKINAQQATFDYTGTVQSYTVPACVNYISVDVRGAQGANGLSVDIGKGGRVQAIVPVTPGEMLEIYVGQQGAPFAGGWNGGGNGGSSSGGGGGASDIRQGGSALSNRIIVAGAGGGAGSCGSCTYAGGNGGGITNGADGWYASQGHAFAGKGGTQTRGGAGGVRVTTTPNHGGGGNLLGGGDLPSVNHGGASGNTGTGGKGGNTYGGGGGGGYYGGGGGAGGEADGGGGSGGSSYATPIATEVLHTQGFQEGHGQIIITPVFSTGPAMFETITGNATVCEGASETYSISPVADALFYIWTLPSGWTGSSTINSINVTAGTAGGIISVAAANACDTSDVSTIEIAVTTALLAHACSDTSMCQGDSIILTASGGANYSWSPPTGLSCTDCQNPVARPSVTTTYEVTVSSGSCTPASDLVQVSVIELPLANAGPDTSICRGNPVTLTASGGTNYSWSPVTGLSCSNCPNPVASPNVTTNYEVTVSSGSCTPSSDMVKVTVNELSLANAGPDTAICRGNPVTLTATGGTNYSWSPVTGLSCSNCPNPLASPNVTTNYEVTVSNGSCIPSSDMVKVTVNELPLANAGKDTAICSGNSIQLNASGGISYNWNPPAGMNNQNIANPLVEPVTTTDYIVIVTDINGCGSTDTITVTVETCAGIAQIPGNINLMLYPNPTQDFLNIQFNKTRAQDLSIAMMNIHGQVIYSETFYKAPGNYNIQLNISSLGKGVYYLKVREEEFNSVSKVIIR